MKAAIGWSHLRGALLILLGLLAATRLCAAEEAANYPTRPIHIIVPFAPGGASDFAIRLIQPGLEKALGQQLVIDNRTGADGNVDVMFVTLSSAAQFVKAGKLKGFAVTTKERVESLPDVPSVVELGFPEDVSGSWQGLFAVKGTPALIVAKLHAAVFKAMADPEVRQHMIAASMVPTSSPTPESFKDFIAAESAKWKKVVEQIKAAGKVKAGH